MKSFRRTFLTNLANYVGQAQTHKDGRNPSSDESFPGLLRAEFNKWSTTHEESKHVGHDVINDDHHDGHNEPDQTLTINRNVVKYSVVWCGAVTWNMFCMMR